MCDSHQMCFHQLLYQKDIKERLDKCYEDGTIYKVITTNLTYQIPELFDREWYVSADVSKYIALLIDNMNHDASISDILDPTERSKLRIEEYKNGKRSF